jgi:GT2 family glycosyltransferase
MDPLDPLYGQAPRYQARRGDIFWILSDTERRGVAVDETVYRIWEAFDGRPTDRVIAALRSEAGFSPCLVESTAKVLARAGLLVPSQPLVSLDRPPARAPSTSRSFPLVSVIVVAGRQARVHLETCLPSVLAQTYPSLEVIVVDNHTTDDSVAFITGSYPQIELIRSSEPLGFGAANNLAMEWAHGEFFFLLNDDTEVEPDCIAECVRTMARSGRTAVVVPKMKLFYLRDFINSMGTSVHANGESYDNFTGYLDVGQFDDTDQVFTACFGAALLRRAVVEQIGYIDEDYLFYYEDSDWSFRARLAGYDIVAASRATVYHKFNATISTLPSAFKAKLVAHNRLRFVWKSFSLARAVKYTWLYREEDCRKVALAEKRGRREIAEAYRQGWRGWLRSLPGLALARRRTRRLRQPSFSEDAIFHLAEAMPPPAMYGPHPVISVPHIRNHYMRLEMFKPRSPSSADDLAGVSAPAAVASPPPLEVARRALRKEGIPGLLKQAWRYVRC